MAEKAGRVVQTDDHTLREAAEIIARGGVVVFPTDTVYGLCCDLFHAEAVDRIYAIKGRPAGMPLIAMFAEVAQWPQVAAAMPATAARYMAQYWPGPLTIIVPARPEIPPEALGGGHTVGLRIPDHTQAHALLAAAGCPLATTSANLSGQPAALTAQQAAEQLGGSVDLIFDAGPTPGGMASTVVDCTTDPPRVLREGPITAQMLGL